MAEDILKRLADAACAVYRVGGRLPADDPLARMLREAALTTTASCVVFFYAPQEYNRKRAHSDIETLCDYFVIARQQRWIDEQNFDVLILEYRAIQRDLTSSLERPGVPSREQYNSEQLSHRQKKIFSYMKDKAGDEVSLKNLRELFPDIVSRTVQRDVQTLLGMRLIEKKGTTHNTTYRFNG